jgi:SRSO17 transposase
VTDARVPVAYQPYLKEETLENTTQRIRPTIHSIINAKRPEPIPKTKPII